MHKAFFLFLAILLTACNLTRSTPDIGAVSATNAPTNPQNCYFNWATQPLPELTAQVQAAINAAGLTGIIATAEAYGENCYDYQTDKPVSFTAMETDFRLSVPMDTLNDYEKLGNLLEKILTVLDGFPTEMTPGLQPGYVGVTFFSEIDELHVWFHIEDGESARALGLHGTALFEELLSK